MEALLVLIILLVCLLGMAWAIGLLVMLVSTSKYFDQALDRVSDIATHDIYEDLDRPWSWRYQALRRDTGDFYFHWIWNPRNWLKAKYYFYNKPYLQATAGSTMEPFNFLIDDDIKIDV